MSLNPYAVQDALNNWSGYDVWGSFDWHAKQNNHEVTIDGTTYPVEFVEFGPDHADYDSSSALYVVFKVGDETFRKWGYYQSHYGSEWDGDIEAVKPREVTKTEWVSA